MHSVEDEFENIELSNDLKYLDEICDYKYGVEITKKEAVLKILIPENYPEEVPTFHLSFLDAEKWNDDMQSAIIKTIENLCGKHIGNPMLEMVMREWESIIKQNIERFSSIETKELALPRLDGKQHSPIRPRLAAQFEHETKTLTKDIEQNKSKYSSRRKEKQVVVKKDAENWKPDGHDERERNAKKTSMKTAKDVINRIQWDQDLNGRDFTLGYEDRFRGIIEVPVLDLNWEDDIASTGPSDKLAIPQHRIQYFKWKSRIIWDKKNRTDNVFGSTANGISIQDFIQRASEEEAKKSMKEVEEQDKNPTRDITDPSISRDDVKPNEIGAAAEQNEIKPGSLGALGGSCNKKLQCLESEGSMKEIEVASLVMEDILQLLEERLSVSFDHDKGAEMELMENQNQGMITFAIQSPVIRKIEASNTSGKSYLEKEDKYKSSKSASQDKRKNGENSRGESHDRRRLNKRSNKRKKKSPKHEKRDSHKPAQLPNYLLAVDLDSHILHAVQDYQINELRWLVRDAVPLDMCDLYLGAFTFNLSSSREYKNLKRVLERICQSWRPFDVEFCKIYGTGREICIDVKDHNRFSDLLNEIKEALKQDSYKYDFKCFPRIKIADSEAEISVEMNTHHHFEFGCQHISSISLWKVDGYQADRYFRFSGHTNFSNQGADPSSLFSDRGMKRPVQGHEETYRRQQGKRPHVRDKGHGWQVKVSKKLAAILRHNLMGFKVDSGGFVDVKKILEHQYFHTIMGARMEDIIKIVETNDKKRFTLVEENGSLRIRANQGHTVEVHGLQLKEITDPSHYPKVVHGTSFQAWYKIKHTGLNRMKRNHIHMSTSEPTDEIKAISGMRNSCNIIIHIDLAKAMEDGIPFFESDNGVILSVGVDGVLEPKYFKEVVGVNYGKRSVLDKVEQMEEDAKKNKKGANSKVEI